MKTNVAHAGDHSVLAVEGRFDIDTQTLFRNAWRKLLPEAQGRQLVVDLSAVDYIDSSALGGLLVLREESGRHSVAVRLTGCRPHVRKILAMAHLDRLFAVAAG